MENKYRVISLITILLSLYVFSDDIIQYLPSFKMDHTYGPSRSVAKKFSALTKTQFGVKADNPELAKIDKIVKEPKLNKTGLAWLTFNKMGFDIMKSTDMHNNWLIQDFLKFTSTATKPVADIGSRFGVVASMAIGVNAQVIAIDPVAEHLIITRRWILDKEKLSKLFLYYGQFPRDVSLPKQSISAVILNRVFIFLTPQEIEQGIAKITEWLIPGGKIFIIANAPQHKQYSNWFMPIYESRWSSGSAWPGVNLDTSTALPDQAYWLPKYLHVMDERPLIKILEKHNFIIERTEFVSMKKFGQSPVERDGKEAIGIIAKLKHI
jgi:hypothetical protein